MTADVLKRLEKQTAAEDTVVPPAAGVVESRRG